jgi:DNA-directed RNA polymerase specialized sigma24 family protein
MPGADAVSDTPTDSELLHDAGHDPLAFRVLYDRWAKPLLAFCYRRTCDPEASLDLVAETFAIAYQKRHRYRDRGPGVGAWLYGIAARELAAYRRRQRVELRACRRLAVTVPPLDDTSLECIEELVDAARWRAALGQALAGLTGAERDAVRAAGRGAARLRRRGRAAVLLRAGRSCPGPSRPCPPCRNAGGDMNQIPALDRLGDHLQQAITGQQATAQRRRRRARWLAAAAAARWSW